MQCYTLANYYCLVTYSPVLMCNFLEKLLAQIFSVYVFYNIVFIIFHEKGDTIILPCHLDNDYQNAGDLYWIKSETGSPGRILTQGNLILDYDLQDRIDEDELELNYEINGKAFKIIIYYLGTGRFLEMLITRRQVKR